ncbi:MAG: hypothetical protein CL610_19240 [Anaerolineaceae bacterium]|nr:hypothetical protein [Anaerolineaceae bacterium]
MQSGFTAHVTAAEWRWVTLVTVALVLLAFAPYGLLILSGASVGDWQFMGVLHNSRDGATYLSKMMLGAQGSWLVQFLHTPEFHSGAFIQVIYPALGHLGALFGIPLLVLFHIARVVASVLMYLAIYQLAATVWMRVRTRRIFFVMASLGAGLGWLYAIVSGGRVDAPDLSIPEAFPLQSTFVNVHFPLAIACLAVLASILIEVFRPGATDEPQLTNTGIIAVITSLALALLYPQALVPLGGALVLFAGWRWWRKKQIVGRELLWLLVVVLPAVPVAIYYAAVVVYNPAMAEWSRQNVTSAPSPLVLAIGFAFPLMIALPGIYRAVRHRESYDDRFMLVWLLVMLVAIYLPTNIQRRFAVGMMLPLAYFATRALEAFWFQRLSNQRWRYRLLMVALPVMALTHLFVLFIPTLPFLVNRPQDTQGLFLERDYIPVLSWLDARTDEADVVLASEVVSLWLPGWSGMRVVYGHPFETLQAETKQAQVEAWYTGEGDCGQLLETFNVRYVIFGPEEARLGDAPCLDSLQRVVRNGEVAVYSP